MPQNTTINTVALRLFRLALGAGQNLDELAGEILDAAVRGGHPEGRARPTIASARGEAERAGPPSLDERRAPGARGRALMVARALPAQRQRGLGPLRPLQLPGCAGRAR